MSICGWNNTMAAGLKLFAEELAEQTQKRAHEENVSVTEVPAIEIAELQSLIDSMRASEKFRAMGGDRKSTRLNSSHSAKSRMPSSA